MPPRAPKLAPLGRLRQLLPVLIALAVYGLLALACMGTPLFNVLGYESAFVFAIVGSLVAAPFAVVWTGRLRRELADPLSAPLSPLGAVLRLYGRVLAVNLLLLLWPLDLLSAHAITVRNCNYFEGLLWFLVLPGLSVTVATAWGVGLGLLGWRKRWSLPCVVAVILVSLAWGVWRFYSAPPVCQYDPFAGYFSGSFYDAHIAITPALLAARVYHLSGALAVLLVAARFYRTGRGRLSWRHGTSRRRLSAAALGSLLVVVGLYFAGGPLAYTTSARDIQRSLGGVHRTPHFVIHYPTGSHTAQDLELHAAEAEFRWQQLRRFFGTAPAHRIRIYIFADDDQKRRLFGAGQVDMAKPWRLEVAITQAQFPHPVLKHELAHAFGAVFGDRLFGVSFRWRFHWGFLPVPTFNPGLIEGAAVAADWRTGGGLTPHQWARAMVEIGRAPPLSQVMSYAFMASAASRSYTVAGSFCRFLVERYGAATFRRVYRSGGDFQGVYGQSLDALGSAWRARVRRTPLTPAERDRAQERFRGRAVFARPCLHEVARLRRHAGEAFAAGRYGRAASNYGKLCDYDPGDPSHLMGHLSAALAAGQEPKALAVAEDLIERHRATTPPLRARAYRLLGNHYWRQNQLGRARFFFQRAASQGQNEAGRRDLTARLLALADPRLGRSLRPLIAPGPHDEGGEAAWAALVRNHPRLGLAHYLLGSYQRHRRRFAAAARSLSLARSLGLPDHRFRRESVWRLGRSYFRAGDLRRARETFALHTGPAETRAVQLLARDWIARVDFWAKHGPAQGAATKDDKPK